MPYMPDISGRGPSTAVLAGRGLVAAALLAGLVALLLMRYQGAFQPVFPVVAVVDDIGDGVRAGADVKLRGVLVGSVGEVRVRPGERPGDRPAHEVALRLRPELARDIPSGVTARVVPTNVFGAPSVELLDPAGRVGGPRLARGEVIPGDRSAGTLQLQTVLNRLNRVLRAVEPAKVNVALTNIAQALQGRGERLGSLIGRGDRYLSTLNAHTDDFTADLALLGSDLRTLAEIAPPLLDAVDRVVVTSRTVVEQREQLAATLTGGTLAAHRIDEFLGDAGDDAARVVDHLRGITSTLAPQRDEIPRSLASLGMGTRKLGEAFRQPGGGLSVTFTLSPLHPYTARDCPRYGRLAGPNCDDPVPPPGAVPGSFPFYQAPPEPPPGLLPRMLGGGR